MQEPLVLSAGHQLRDQAPSLAEAVVACEFARYPRLRQRYGPAGRYQSRQDAAGHLTQLADALDVDSPALFNDYIGWVRVLLQQRGLAGEDLDRHLGCMAEVLHEQMPAPVAAPAVAIIDGARAALPAMPAATPSFLDAGQRLTPLAREYLRAMLGGYRQAAGQLVFDAAGRGEPVRELYLQVFQPALREIGRLWQLGQVSVAQEHFCSAATQVLMSRLLTQAPAVERNGRGAVIACVSGNLHEVGARMVGDFFEMSGWDSYYCGADTPHDAIVQSVLGRRADVLAVSASMGCQLHVVQELLERVRAEAHADRLRVMVGGHPFNVDPALWRAVGADGTAADADAAVALADGWPAGASAAS